jgi:predicted dehydrogenase
MKWGLLSTANINRKLLEGVRETDEATVVAVASRDRSRAEQFAREHGIERALGSYEELLEDPEVEAIYNPLPNSLHVPWSVRALEAGKHVLCEKPMSRRVADVEHAFDVAERADRVLMEGFMWRYHEQTALVERLLREGALGPVRHVRAAFSFALAPDSGDLRWNASLDGGALMDVGCYCVSGLRLLLGEPVRVRAEQVTGGPGAGVDARMAGVLRFDGDVLGSFECGIDTVGRGVLEVFGRDGALISSDPWHGGSPQVVRIGGDGTRETLAVERVNAYAREVEDLSRAVREGGRPRLGRADAVGQARTIDALYRSAAEGRAVDVG